MSKVKRQRRGYGSLEIHGRVYRARYFALDSGSTTGFRRIVESTGISVDGSDKEDSDCSNSAKEAREHARKRAELWLEERTAPYRQFVTHGKFASDIERLKKVARMELSKTEGVEAQMREDLERLEAEQKAYDFKEAWDVFDSDISRRDRGASTHENYLQWYNLFVAWLKDNHPSVQELRGVTPQMARDYSSYILKDRSGSTHNRHFNCLDLIWRTLSRKEVDGTFKYPHARLGKSPFGYDTSTMSGVPRVRLVKSERPHRRRDLTLDEIRAILCKAIGEMKILIAVGFYTGLRLKDCALLSYSMIDRLTMSIRTRSSKTDIETDTRIHPCLVKILQENAPTSSGYVMPKIAALYNSGKTGRAELCKRIKALFESCGIETSYREEGKRARPDATFHSLRHAYDTQLKRAGVGLRVRQELMGHANATMTEYYTHEDANAALALPDLLTEKGEDDPTCDKRYADVVNCVEGLSTEDLKRLLKHLEHKMS